LSSCKSFRCAVISGVSSAFLYSSGDICPSANIDAVETLVLSISEVLFVPTPT
jgi:hypothetical protein